MLAVPLSPICYLLSAFSLSRLLRHIGAVRRRADEAHQPLGDTWSLFCVPLLLLRKRLCTINRLLAFLISCGVTDWGSRFRLGPSYFINFSHAHIHPVNLFFRCIWRTYFPVPYPIFVESFVSGSRINPVTVWHCKKSVEEH